MPESDDPRPEDGALCHRMSALNGAILRISASLDLDTVLGEGVESAHDPTGARRHLDLRIQMLRWRLDTAPDAIRIHIDDHCPSQTRFGLGLVGKVLPQVKVCCQTALMALPDRFQ